MRQMRESIASLLVERIFQSTPDRVLSAHTEWSARCVTEAFSTTYAVCIKDCEGWWLFGGQLKQGILGLIRGNCRFLPLNMLLFPAEVRSPKKGFSLGVGCNGLLNPPCVLIMRKKNPVTMVMMATNYVLCWQLLSCCGQWELIGVIVYSDSFLIGH